MHPLQTLTRENAELVAKVLEAALVARKWAWGIPPLTEEEEQRLQEMVERSRVGLSDVEGRA